jgi:hypothetical protein
MIMSDHKHLQADDLTRTANDALRRFQERLHEVPAKDLPACAAALLDLAERQKPRKRGKNEPEEA